MARYLVKFFATPYIGGGFGPGFSSTIETNSPKDAAKQAYRQMLAQEAQRVPRQSIDDMTGVRGKILRTNINLGKHGISAAPAYPEWNLHVKQGSGVKFHLDFILTKVE